MPNTLTTIFTSNPATEPVEAPHPNTGTYVTGTQATVGGPWMVVHTLVSKTTTPLTMVGRLKNYPTVTVSVVASGGPNAGNIFNNILATPTGTGATPVAATPSTALSVVVSSIANQTGYRLLSSDTQTGTYTQIYQSTTASYPHTGLTAGQTKWYQWQYVGGGYYDDSLLSVAFSGATTAAAAPVAAGEAMVLNLLVGGAVQNSAGVLSAPGAAQFAAQCNSTKFLATGPGYRGFFQVTSLASQNSGSFFGSGVAGGGKVDITYGMLLNNGVIIPLNNKAGMNSPGPFAINDVLRADFFGPDAASPDLPNGGARYYKNGALLVSVPGALAFPLYCDFGISDLSSLGALRIGGPGLSV